MGAQLTAPRMALPPPVAKVITDMDRQVGWIDDRVIGFRGFGDAMEAAHAAQVAHRTLARRLAWRTGDRPVPVSMDVVAIDRGVDHERIVAGGWPIATLVRPGPGSRSGVDSFGFEIPLPESAGRVDMRAKARLVYRTLRKSGIRWALWAREPRRQPWRRPSQGSPTIDRPQLRPTIYRAAPAAATVPSVAASAAAASAALPVQSAADRWLFSAAAIVLVSFVLLVLALLLPDPLTLVLGAAGLAGIAVVRVMAMRAGLGRLRRPRV